MILNQAGVTAVLEPNGGGRLEVRQCHGTWVKRRRSRSLLHYQN